MREFREQLRQTLYFFPAFPLLERRYVQFLEELIQRRFAFLGQRRRAIIFLFHTAQPSSRNLAFSSAYVIALPKGRIGE